MGIFGKKKADEFESLHNDNLFSDDDDIIIPAGEKRVGVHRIGQNSAFAPHALTANEVTNSRTEEIPMTSHPKPDSVYQRMKEREQQNTATAIEDDYVPSWAIASTETKTLSVNNVMSQKPTAHDEAKVSEVIKVSAPATPVTASVSGATPTTSSSASTDAFLERCRIAVEKATHEDTSKERRPAEQKPMDPVKQETKPLIAEEKHEETKAESRSVDDIIRMLRGETPDGRSDKPSSEKVVEAVAETTDNTSKIEEKPVAEKASVPTDTFEVKLAVEENNEKFSVEEASADNGIKVEVEVIPSNSDSDIMHTTGGRRVGDEDVRIYGKIVRGAVIQHTPEGDVEATQFIRAPKVSQDTIVADDKTVMFGDLGDIISQKADDEFDSEKFTPDDDFDDDDFFEDLPYYETADPELDGIDDYKTLNDSARLRTKLMEEKSKNKTSLVFSGIFALVMLIVSVLPTSVLPRVTVAIMEFILLVAAIIVNHDVYADFKNLFKLRPKFDSLVAIASTVMLIQCGLSAFVFGGNFGGFAIATGIMLFVNRIARFMKSSRILRGLEIIATSEEKRAVVSVNGNNAKVISSGAVEGEALVLCDRKAVNIRDYLKNCGYDSPFDCKIKTLLAISAGIALVVGIVVSYFLGIGSGFSIVSALLCCVWPACTALICELPMYLVSKKLSGYGAMLAGYKGAYELNLANLVAVNSSDLFPEGSVRLYNMKALGENEIGKTLIDAAAVAIAANSPLSAIFLEILGNTQGNSLPKVNGVQYEDKMGVSGWIGEKTILIGNRNLMQGHNIAVPPASVDQKILKAGYFPVYIAVDGVPCLLFIVQYDTDPEVAHELQMLCNTGMTVVVDPKDPNTTEAMICDYFGLPDDALKVMNHNGRVSYERTSAEVETASAPASFGKNVCGFFSAVTSSIKLKGIYAILTAIMIVAAVLGVVLTVYLGISGKTNLVNPLTLSGFQLFFVAISALIAKIKLS
ncbi:MAG: hypothetical protein J6Q76_05565 [Clostridia bacterium]|nr:hypothetical protein [Clostridia bacterium]